MEFGSNVSEISFKDTETLGFLWRNVAFAPESTMEVAYKSLARLKLEYAHCLAAITLANIYSRRLKQTTVSVALFMG